MKSTLLSALTVDIVFKLWQFIHNVQHVIQKWRKLTDACFWLLHKSANNGALSPRPSPPIVKTPPPVCCKGGTYSLGATLVPQALTHTHTHPHLPPSSISPAVLRGPRCHSPSPPGPAAPSAGAFPPPCQGEWEQERQGGNGTRVTSSHSWRCQRRTPPVSETVPASQRRRLVFMQRACARLSASKNNGAQMKSVALLSDRRFYSTFLKKTLAVRAIEWRVAAVSVGHAVSSVWLLLKWENFTRRPQRLQSSRERPALSCQWRPKDF